MATTLLDDVKNAMRINHTALDGELTANIAEARAEMKRAGIDEDIADGNDALIVAAVKTYCKMVNADTPADNERYEKSWLYQLDCLRKSTLGGEEPNV